MVAIIGLLASIAIATFSTYTIKVKNRICFENLTQMESAKQLWGLDHNKRASDTPTDADIFGSDRYIRVKPECPNGGTYSLNAIRDKATCTYPGHDLNIPP